MTGRTFVRSFLAAAVTLTALVGAQPALAQGGAWNAQYYNDPFVRHEPSVIHKVKRYAPAVIGATAGAVLGGRFGWIGRIAGGAVGWWVGNKIGRALFPGHWYDDTDHYRYYQRQQSWTQPDYGLRPSTTSGTDSPFTFMPMAPQTGDLGALRDAYFSALRDYQAKLAGSDEAAKTASRAAYETAYKAYQDAKAAAGQ